MSKTQDKTNQVPSRPEGLRLLWGSGGGRLVDPDGTEYEPVAWDLPAKEVKRFVRRGQTPFAVQECGCGVEWFDPADTAAVWDRIRPDFQDVEECGGPANAPGAGSYRATLWKALTGRQHVLLLSDE
jgi:hypothetical protein